MRFSNLPWFIREDIFKLVIEEEPEYCRIDKEWLKLVAVKHGFISIDLDPPEIKKKITLFTPHIKRIKFFRTTDINWTFVYSNKNITDVSIPIEEESPPNTFDDLLTKCLQLPPLEKLRFIIAGLPRFDLSPLIKNNQLYLKELSVSVLGESWQRDLDRMIFPNLVHLDLVTILPKVIEKITKGMPNLRSLSLTFSKTEDTVIFRDFQLPNLTKLNLNSLFNEAAISADLNSLSNLKNLILNGSFKLIGRHLFDRVEGLQVYITSKSFRNQIHPRFPNLRALDLDMPDKQSLSSLRNLLKCLTTLKIVRCNLFCLEPLENLPNEPYAITDLVLGGVFYTSPYLLHWLSSSLELVTLDLHACYLREKPFQSVSKFKTLHKLKIRVRPNFVNIFNQNFNQRTHPHIDFIEIASCRCIDIATEVLSLLTSH